MVRCEMDRADGELQVDQSLNLMVNLWLVNLPMVNHNNNDS